MVAVLVATVPMGMLIYQEYVGKFSVLIASSPAAAEIRLDGTAVGTTPLTLELKKGTYILGASRKGYEPLEHAIYVDLTGNNLVNIQLLPAALGSPPTSTGRPAANIADPHVQALAQEVEKLRSIIVLEPEDAATIPILTQKVLRQAESLKAMRDELKDIREQGKWYIGSVIAIIVGLMGVIATLFIANRGN